MDGTIEGDGPDAPSEPRCDPSQPFLNPVLLANVNSSFNDDAPRLSSDELELFFASDRPGGAGSFDLYVAKRSTREADFEPPQRIVELSTSAAEYGPFLSADNLTLYYHPPLEVYVARRPSRAASFGAGVQVSNVNSGADDSEPYLTLDEKVMYLPSTRQGGYDIYRAAWTGGSFGSPTAVAEINSAASDESHPVASSDDLTIYWATNRPESGSAGPTDIWVATRPSVAAPFGGVMRHGTLNSPANEEAGWLSADSCVMYIMSDRAGGQGSRDLYVARRPR